MSDNPTPSSLSSVPGNGGYRNKLNNWLQSRPGWRERFTWDKESHGPDDDPTWFAVGRFDGNEYGRGEGKTLAHAKEEAARIALRRLTHEFDAKPLIERRMGSPAP